MAKLEIYNIKSIQFEKDGVHALLDNGSQVYIDKDEILKVFKGENPQ